MTEEFRWIKGFEGMYKVSNLGRFMMVSHVDSMGRMIPARIKCTRKGVGGYTIVSLRKEGKKVTYLAHRLVAEAFIPNPENKPFVDHIDGSRNNNTIANLRWATAAENNANPITYPRMLKGTLENPVCGNKNPYSREISQYSIKGYFIAKYESIGLAAKRTQICYTCIVACAKGKRKTAGGFKWKYESEPKLLVNSGKRHPKGYMGNKVLQLSLDGKVLNEYVSIKEAARLCNMNATSISRAIRGKYRQSGGYIWQFKEQ